MKIVVFGDERRVGVWDGDDVVDVNKAAAAYLASKGDKADAATKAPSDLMAFIAAGKPALELAKAAVAHAKGSSDKSLVQPVSAVKLHAPWPRGRIFCAGANYGQHVANYVSNMGQKTTAEEVKADTRKFEPGGFTKSPLEVRASGEDVTYPSRTTQMDFEAELTVVIGARGKDIPLGEAKNYIWGVTLANDWSDRDAPPARMPLSFNLMKNFDDCLSLGPCILVDDSDPQGHDVTLEVNGKVRQSFNSRDMIYSFAEYIAHLSRDLTLAPGDLLLGGTGENTAIDASPRNPDGTVVHKDLFLKVGDVVEIKSPKIGSLKNRIVAKT